MKSEQETSTSDHTCKKMEPKSESTMSLLADDLLKCSICKDMFTDPVNIPCGHCYCKLCITSHWTVPTQDGDFKCPECLQSYSTRPELYIAGVVRQMLKRARYSPVRPACLYAMPGDVACGVCSGIKLRAVKFCLTCVVAFCETHVKTHYEDPVLKNHRRVDVSEVGKWLCVKHHKVLDVFCNDDQSSICCSCALLEHRNHNIHITDSREKASMLTSGSLDTEYFCRSPFAGTTGLDMRTPPTGMASGTSLYSSRDSDSGIPMIRRCNENVTYSLKNMNPVRKLQFDDQKEEETKGSCGVSMLTRKLMKMQNGT